MSFLKPSFFPVVPRLLNRIYGLIQGKFDAATGIKGALVRQALKSKLYYLRNGEGFTHAIYDRLVFDKVKSIIGGNIQGIITGSAPIAGEVLDFLKICFCCSI